MKKLFFAMAIGAALAWFLDPNSGAGRRATVKKRLEEKGIMSSDTGAPASEYTPPAAVSSIP